MKYDVITIPPDIYRFYLSNFTDDDLYSLSNNLRLNLNFNELKSIRDYFVNKLNRAVFDLELYSFSQLWSEHCRHKVFRGIIVDDNGNVIVDDILKSYIAKATEKCNKPWIVSFLKDNAGIIEFDDKYSIAVKVETHNHPSAIDPFGGAATGIGGVIRDILGVWASPIACIDVLCFGPLNYPYESIPKGLKHPKYLFRGVVKGIGFYGNNMGIPTVAGAICFDEGYVGNVVVYAGCIGILPTSTYRFSAKPRDKIVLMGNSTGRDGIHGASFASSDLKEDSERIARSAVQIPDPVEEEKLRRAIIRIRDENLASGITDLGGGGLAVAVTEMAGRINGGARVFLDSVHLREDLLPWEIWISESQERMLLIVPENSVDKVLEIASEEELKASVIGELIDEPWIDVYYKGYLLCHVETNFLLHPPKITRIASWIPPKFEEPILSEPENYGEVLCKLLSSPNICSREEVIRTYDHEVQGATVIKPLHGFYGGPSDAAVLKPISESYRGIVVSVGIKPWYSRIDPYWMAASSLEEALRNNACVGGRRIAILDNFTWGNPEKPDRLGSLVRAAKACYDFAVEFDTPFISGKDSLYNESPMGPVLETLLITAIGIIPDIRKTVTLDFKGIGDPVFIVGLTFPELGASQYYRLMGYIGSSVPKVNAKYSKKIMDFVINAIDMGYVKACHDISDGGLGVAIAEMALSSDYGVEVYLNNVPRSNVYRDDILLFSESNGRFILEVDKSFEDDFIKLLREWGCDGNIIGRVTSSSNVIVYGLKGNLLFDLKTNVLRDCWRSGLKL
ncbi:MAG: phosphoribosylformylglycinamidine synthase subunit PurL [Candidatus Methanomethylicia archaeon]